MSLEKFTLSGYSTALFSTWYFIDEWKLLFDCGDGVCSSLLQKSRKVTKVFVTHPDRDHMDGLLQFNQLNSRSELSIHYPKDSGSFPALQTFANNFDPHVSGTKWVPLDRETTIPIRSDLQVRTIENRHVPNTNGMVKSLSYVVDRVSKKLKPELAGLDGQEIGRLRKEKGEDAITDTAYRPIFAFSGDMPIENDGRFNDVETLIHEATFLTEEEIDPSNPHRNKHSSLDQVFRMVAESNIKRLVLGHFSSRYDHDDIDRAIEKNRTDYGVTIPVYRLLPGETVKDLFRESGRTSSQ